MATIGHNVRSRTPRHIIRPMETELLFLALLLRFLEAGGRAAVIVSDGVLFGSSTAHKTLRKRLVEEQKLDAVEKPPPGAFRPYAGVSTSNLFLARTDFGGTQHGWFYDGEADGWSLDDKGSTLPSERKQEWMPSTPLWSDEHLRNNLPVTLKRRVRGQRNSGFRGRVPKRASSFRCPTSPLMGTPCPSTADRRSSTRRSSPSTLSNYRRSRRSRAGDPTESKQGSPRWQR